MTDGNNPQLLDRLVGGLRDFVGQPGHRQIKTNAEWVRQQFDANPAMRREYLQAAVSYPQLFQNDEATIFSNVEAVVGHFARDGLTRSDYFKALDAEPLLLRQKPAALINNIDAVLDHYAADQQMRTDYLRAAADQPILFRTPSTMVFASIEAAVDHLEDEGITRSDYLRRAVDEPRLLTQAPQAIRARTTPESSPPLTDRAQTGQMAVSGQLPSTVVVNPALYMSYVAPAQARGR
jgi:hypothetical protein